MTTALISIFILSLAVIVLHSLNEARTERLGPGSSRSSGNKRDWLEIANELDLELISGDESNRVLRGTVGEHWVTIETVDGGVHINMNYHSGVAPFTVTANNEEEGTDTKIGNTADTGDEAFDAELTVATASPGELDDYFSPARRNALLWLSSAFEIDSVSDEHIRVLLASRRWNAEAIVSAVRLVEDVADILDEGEKVFMAPPVAASAGEVSEDDGGQ